jgi:hypothetical protein
MALLVTDAEGFVISVVVRGAIAVPIGTFTGTYTDCLKAWMLEIRDNLTGCGARVCQLSMGGPV